MITGTGEAMIFSMMSRVESTNPPGVLISISTAWLWLAAADWRARSMYSAVMGWMASLTTILRTSAEAEEDSREDRAKRMSSNRSVRMGSAAAALSPRAGLLRAPFDAVTGAASILLSYLTPLRGFRLSTCATHGLRRGLCSCAASRLAAATDRIVEHRGKREFHSEGGNLNLALRLGRPSRATFSDGDGFVFRSFSFDPSGQFVAAGDQAGSALVG